MGTTDPTRENITANNPPTARAEMWALGRSLTTNLRDMSAIERAYGDHGPDSYKRSVEQRRAWEQIQLSQVSPVAAANAPGKARRVRRRSVRRATRPLRGLVNTTCAYEPCSKPFEWEWPIVCQLFCSPTCRRSAASLRETDAAHDARPVDRTAVLAEMESALEGLRAFVGEQVDR